MLRITDFLSITFLGLAHLSVIFRFVNHVLQGIYTSITSNKKNTITATRRYDSKSSTISLKYIGMAQTTIGPAFHYKISEKNDFSSIRLLFIPKEGKSVSNTSESISDSQFRTGNGEVDLYIGAADMSVLKGIQMVSVYF